MKQQPPSVKAIVAFYEGQPNGFARLLGTFIGRAIMLSAGYEYIAKAQDSVKLGFIGSAIIEAYLLWYYSRKLA